MAFFRNEDYERLDYQLLVKGGAVNLYCSEEILSKDIQWLKTHGYCVNEFDCNAWLNQEQMSDELAEKLEFPEYYASNLDALNDYFCDIEISDETGRVIVLKHFDKFHAQLPEIASGLLGVIAYHFVLHLLFGKRLFALVQANDLEFTLKVGAIQKQYITLNFREHNLQYIKPIFEN